jgi:hypothetical protein
MVGCDGGGGSGNAGNNGNITINSVSGVVIDGYLEGAEVCLDLNRNRVCDAGEPTATTDANGRFVLNTSGFDADGVRNAILFVTVPTTAKDDDDKGKTLAEAGKAAFNLMSPMAAFNLIDNAINTVW